MNEVLHKLAFAAVPADLVMGALTGWSAAVWSVFAGAVCLWALTSQ